MSARDGQRGASVEDANDRRALSAQLGAIFGVEQSREQMDEVYRLFPTEGKDVLEALRLMSVPIASGSARWTGNRHWKRTTQSCRTDVLIEFCADGRLTLVGKDANSHGFLAAGSTDLGLRALEGRRVLCESLRNCLATETYKPLLEWIVDPARSASGSSDAHEAGPPRSDVQEMAGDSALGVSLYEIDHGFQTLFHHHESRWRSERAAPDHFATPPHAVEEIAARAASGLLHGIDKAAQRGSDADEEDSLAIRVAAAVSANRAIDEIWSWCASEIRAADDAATMLQVLKAKNVTAIPQQFVAHTDRSTLEENLVAWASRYFGPSGLVAGDQLRAMSHAEIEAIVILSGRAQQAFIRRQALRLGIQLAEHQYGENAVRFLFFFAFAAAYGLTTHVSNEFPGEKNSTKAVFPSRSELKEQVPEQLSAHAITYIERMVALLHRSVGQKWTFDEAALRAQCAGKVLRFAKQVNVYKYAVDNRTAAEIREICGFLNRMRNS